MIEFLSDLPTAAYEWGDLARLIRKDQQPDPRQVITGCIQGYAFLRALTPLERALTQDRHRLRQDLFDQLTRHW